MSLSTPESVQKLQMALHDKAKEAPSFRFYALYDKVYRKDVLTFKPSVTIRLLQATLETDWLFQGPRGIFGNSTEVT